MMVKDLGLGKGGAVFETSAPSVGSNCVPTSSTLSILTQLTPQVLAFEVINSLAFILTDFIANWPSLAPVLHATIVRFLLLY